MTPSLSKVVVSGHCLVTLPITINETSKVALIPAYLNAGTTDFSLVVTMERYVCILPLPTPLL